MLVAGLVAAVRAIGDPPRRGHPGLCAPGRRAGTSGEVTRLRRPDAAGRGCASAAAAAPFEPHKALVDHAAGKVRLRGGGRRSHPTTMSTPTTATAHAEAPTQVIHAGTASRCQSCTREAASAVRSGDSVSAAAVSADRCTRRRDTASAVTATPADATITTSVATRTTTIQGMFIPSTFDLPVCVWCPPLTTIGSAYPRPAPSCIAETTSRVARRPRSIPRVDARDHL